MHDTMTKEAAAAPRQQLPAVRQQSDLLPATWWLDDTTWQALERLCSRLAGSDMVPDGFAGAPGNCFVALMAGLPLGLSPLACLQSFAVINGRPTLWGDAPVAQVLADPDLLELREEATGTIEAEDRSWTITVVRRMANGGKLTVARSYSVDDAKRAKLWGKVGREGRPTPWVTNPDRMLFSRARAFALRDAFADRLKGVSIAADRYGDGEEVKPADFTVAAAPATPAPADPVVTVTENGFAPAEPPAPKRRKGRHYKRGPGTSAQPGDSCSVDGQVQVMRIDCTWSRPDAVPAGELQELAQLVEFAAELVEELKREPTQASGEPAASSEVPQQATPPAAPVTAGAEAAAPAAAVELSRHLPSWAIRQELQGLLGRDGERQVFLATEVWTAQNRPPEGTPGDLLYRLLPGAAHRPQLLLCADRTWTQKDPEDQELLPIVRKVLVAACQNRANQLGIDLAELLQFAQRHVPDQQFASLGELTARSLVVLRAALAAHAAGELKL